MKRLFGSIEENWGSRHRRHGRTTHIHWRLASDGRKAVGFLASPLPAIDKRPGGCSSLPWRTESMTLAEIWSPEAHKHSQGQHSRSLAALINNRWKRYPIRTPNGTPQVPPCSVVNVSLSAVVKTSSMTAGYFHQPPSATVAMCAS